ncbi:fimbrial protein [Serratia fonticola]|uniref:fimbrial protein n=1 Tax=Serratia fonticola TaxID=47917 RepID=UPI00192CB676|nr:fimbrial protein [Serratia fonticola]MBL5905350.1 fimbrial protein [Serratia fonticola]
MMAKLRQYLPGCGLAALGMLCGLQVLADTTIRVTVTIVAPPSCVINNNNLIEVNFGNDVMINRIDGTYKKKPVVYSLECKSLTSNMMKMQIEGTPAGVGFGSNVLRTQKNGLGVALLRNGYPQQLNSWVNFSYSNRPSFEVVPVKLGTATLSGGRFSAGATMKVEYQ